MKKKLIFLLVLALMFQTSALAISLPQELLSAMGVNMEQKAFTVVEDRVNIAEGFLGYSGEYVAVIKNETDQPLLMSVSTVDLTDKDGQTVKTVEVMQSLPNTVAPGEVAYISHYLLSVEKEEAERIAGHKANIMGTVNSQPLEKVLKLSAETTYEVADEYDYLKDREGKGVSTLTTVENSSDQNAFDAYVVNVFRDKQGKLLTVQYTMMGDVGILPGTKVLVKNELEMGFVQQFYEESKLDMDIEATAYYYVENK